MLCLTLSMVQDQRFKVHVFDKVLSKLSSTLLQNHGGLTQLFQTCTKYIYIKKKHDTDTVVVVFT